MSANTLSPKPTVQRLPWSWPVCAALLLGLLLLAVATALAFNALNAVALATPPNPSAAWQVLACGVVSFLLLLAALFGQWRGFLAQKQAEKAFLRSALLARAMIESLAEPLLVTTLEGQVIQANRAASALFGYPQSQLLGGDMVQMLLPVRQQMEFAAYFGALVGRPVGFKQPAIELKALRQDGSEFTASLSITDLQVGGKRFFSVLVHDASVSRQAIDDLRRNSAQLRKLIDTVPALIAYLDHNQRFQIHNMAYEENFSRSAAQMEGHTLLEVMGFEVYAQIQPYVAEVMAGYAVNHEHEWQLSNGQWRTYLMSYFPNYANAGSDNRVTGFFVLGTDVTELKRIDRMKSEFVSTVSHELRTPLTSIRGSLGLVWSGVVGTLPEKAQALVGIAKNNCERLIRLINDILDSEKIESGKMRFEMQTIELAPLLEQALAASEGLASQHQVTLQLRLPTPRSAAAAQMVARVQADSDRLMQVLANLLSNAVKFSPPGGEIQLRLRRGGGRVRVEVHDQGPGISEEFKKRIFQKFSQADSSDTRQKGGTGLGLNISRLLIERMNGTIGFANPSPGQTGSIFYFELPEWREAPPVTAPMGLHDIRRPRVLVCEDDPDVARLIGMILDREGFDADMAHTAAQAREHLQLENYAAMTCDIKLPFENGLKLVAELRQQPRTAHLPVLVLSVLAEEARQHGGHYALSISDWLEKPLDEKRLVQCLRRAIQSSQQKKKSSTGSF